MLALGTCVAEAARMTISKNVLLALAITVGGCGVASTTQTDESKPEKRKAILRGGSATPIECEQVEDACVL